jgi:predicted Fe-Mo cluster-binding NifX family protein
MKIVITAEGKEPGSALDGRFGRCGYFVFYDTDVKQVVEVLENPSAQAAGGAGIQAAQLVVNRGAQAVLTGNVGPNAVDVLNKAGVKIHTGLSGTVQEAVDKFLAGNLASSSGPTVSAHAGTGGAPIPPPASSNPGTGGGRGAGFGRGGGGGRGMGRGGGRGRGFGGGPPADCVCPSCGQRVTHSPGTPCRSLKCPKCGTVMVRGD